MPKEISAKLDTIFLVGLFHTSDLKKFGHAAIFSRIVSELKDLESNGILLNAADNTVIRVKFILSSIVGDAKR